MTDAGRVSRSSPAEGVGRVSRSRPGEHAREWRQFRLLVRDSMRRLLNAAMLSRDGDPWQFAIWVTALLATPSFFYAFGQIGKYTALRSAPLRVMAPVIAVDRLFFVVYAIVTAALLAALTWDALVPDRTDQEIVGVLPVRPRTLAAARLAGALGVMLMFSAVVHLPMALIFALVAVANPVVGAMPLVFAGHALATVGAALTTFAALLIVRGITAMMLSAAAANALAGVLQLVSVAALIETFIYLPAVLPYLARQMLGSTPLARELPPIWFASIYTVISGPSRAAVAGTAALGTAAVAVTVVAAVLIHLPPAGWLARRVLSSSSKEATRYAASAIRVVSLLLCRTPAIRSMAAFTLGTFTRSRRHVFVLLTYLGFAVGVAAINVIAATVRHQMVLTAPSARMMALPLVLIFFAVLGLRTAFNIPVEYDANWPFRLVGTRVTDASRAARAAMFALAVLPVAAAAGALAWALGWGAQSAMRLMAFDLVAGVLLIQAVTFGWRIVPFTRAHVPAVQNVRSRALVVLVPLYVFAYRGADLQLAALPTSRGAFIYLVAFVTACAIVGALSGRESLRQGLTFEHEQGEALTTLSLSEAAQ
jgi:hypothetical protein